MNERILIVEDDPAISKLLQTNLAVAGYQTTCAMDGCQALEAIGNAPFDLALCDIMLPEVDGFELLPLMQQKHIPVIFVSAKTDIESRVQGLRLSSILLAFVFQRSMQPLQRLTQITQKVAAGHYDLRSNIGAKDEVGELSASFDAMAETVEQKILSLEDTARRQKLLLGALTHEMKTPMTAIIGYAQSILISACCLSSHGYPCILYDFPNRMCFVAAGTTANYFCIDTGLFADDPACLYAFVYWL